MSISNRVAVPDAAEPIRADSAPAAIPAAVARLAPGERELRIDLFRGLALWLIFIDHLSPDLLTFFTIRSYGFSDAAEIFIFISGYTAAFVYGRAMRELGFVVASARILRRVWQIYVANILLFTVFFGEICYLSSHSPNPLYRDEMGVLHFLAHPDIAIVQALILRFRLLNMDVLPLYVVLMFFLPIMLWVAKWRIDLLLALSIILYVMTSKFDLYLTAYPDGYWAFNPFAWQMLFVFGVWCALGGGKRLSGLLASPITLWVCVVYLVAACGLALTWYFPQMDHVLPERLERWIYPISKPDLDILRFLHFLALAAITVRFVPGSWPGLKSPWLRPMILCGQHSLEIFCLGVSLSFAGYFVLIEIDGHLAMHFLVAFAGILMMWGVAWMNDWYRRSDAQSRARIRATNAAGDFVGAG